MGSNFHLYVKLFIMLIWFVIVAMETKKGQSLKGTKNDQISAQPPMVLYVKVDT